MYRHVLSSNYKIRSYYFIKQAWMSMERNMRESFTILQPEKPLNDSGDPYRWHMLLETTLGKHWKVCAQDTHAFTLASCLFTFYSHLVTSHAHWGLVASPLIGLHTFSGNCVLPFNYPTKFCGRYEIFCCITSFAGFLFFLF